MIKKTIALILLVLFLICPVIAEESHATTVFLTSDNVMGHDEDFKMLNQIKDYIEADSNGNINVIVDENGSSPGEGTRVISANCDYAVTIAYACAGNLDILAKYAASSDKKITYVNAGSLDLNNLNFLRRAYDDNWSNSSFASIKQPGKFLNDSGITVLQPTQKYSSESNNGNMQESSDKINKYIADSIINQINSGTNSSKTYDRSLVVYHSLAPKYLAEDSQKIVNNYGSTMNDSYGSYSTAQLLYMSSSYLTGYGLEVPGDYKAPNNPAQYSFLTQKSYTFTEYTEMADQVVDYMNTHHQAPDSINYKGATISYYDLVYNFALLTENQTDASHMNFPQESDFHKYNENILLDIIPIIIIIIVILAIIHIIRKIKKAIAIRKNKKNRNKRNYNYQKNIRNNQTKQNQQRTNDLRKRK